MKKLNKSGMSMIELIVVITIFAIMICILPMSISSVFTMNAKKCADDIDTALSLCKVNSMSRSGDVYMRIVKETDGIYVESYVDDVVTERDKIGNSSLSVLVYDSSAEPSMYNLEDGAIYFSFNRSNGSCCTISTAINLSHLPDDGLDDAEETELYYTSLVVRGYNKSYVIRLEWPTGKHFVEVESD